MAKKKELVLEFGKNIKQIEASTKNRKGFVKLVLEDEVINDFFRNYFNKQVKIKLIMDYKK